jgi:phosphatidylinositol kinase/protein kinase (PI-3  family)
MLIFQQVSGIIGSFKITCVNSMRVLRENKESLLAVLEAFVYDPLINWRLMQHDMEGRRPEGNYMLDHRLLAHGLSLPSQLLHPLRQRTHDKPNN